MGYLTWTHADSGTNGDPAFNFTITTGDGLQSANGAKTQLGANPPTARFVAWTILPNAPYASVNVTSAYRQISCALPELRPSK